MIIMRQLKIKLKSANRAVIPKVRQSAPENIKQQLNPKRNRND
jgi:hypothetical protein